jgi:Arc/MetJ-type ribon-helix-helix transcriptional regulator
MMDNTEKVSVNINIGTLSQIDLLVDQGFFSNRSDFINQAVREYLNGKQEQIRAEEENYDKYNFVWFIGLRGLTKTELELVKKQGHKKEIRGYGMLLIDESLDDLVIDTISSINVRGKIRCSDRIREYYQL